METPLFTVDNTRRQKDTEMFGGRFEGKSDLFGDIADARLFCRLEEAQNRESTTIRKRFHNPLEVFLRYSVTYHTHLFYHSRELEKRGRELLLTGGGEEAPEDDAEGDEDVEPAERVDALGIGRGLGNPRQAEAHGIYQVIEYDGDRNIPNCEFQPFSKSFGICEKENDRNDGEHLSEEDERKSFI